MLKRKLFALALIFAAATLYAAELSGRVAASLASVFEKPYGAQMFSAIARELGKLPRSEDRRSLLFAFAEYEERAGHFENAAAHYTQAAGIYPENLSMYLDGARCFMYMNEGERARALIQKTLVSGPDSMALARARFYLACVQLAAGDVERGLEQIRTQLSDRSFAPYFSQMLFILWYVASDSKAGLRLISDYPSSAEASIVRGEVTVVPRAFWYFMPASKRPMYLEGIDQSTAGIWLQTGFFNSRINAEAQAEKLTQAGFRPFIRRETRQGGAVSFAVLVPENTAGTTAALLKEKGFESYLVID